MIKSMTGYGKGEAPYYNGRIIIEIRSVNHRYGEITVKLPRIFMQYENEVKKLAASVLKRGKIDIFAQLQGASSIIGLPTVNLTLAGSYHKAFTNIKEALGLDDEVSLQLIATQKDVISISEIEADCEQSGHELLASVCIALDNLDAMRLSEGEALESDLLKRRNILNELILAVIVRVPKSVTTNVDKLKERVALLVGDSGVSEERLAQEIALIADRSDITEELVRFDSHMKQFDEIIKSADPVGRKLDFLLQEINREVNTIGSKANDMEITSLVIDMKAELEKIREQVQNIE